LSEKIEKLSDFQHSRRRTEMYLGSRDPHTQVVLEYTPEGPKPVESTWVPAVFTAFREILDNALDEVVAHGHGDRIDVEFRAGDNQVTISDNGRGIPFDWDDTHNTHLATLALTETKAGRNFGERGETRGLNGVGASVVNFCSEWFNVEITRGKQQFTQRFREGDELIIEQPFIFPSDGKSGTKVTYKLSGSVFHDLRLPESFIRSRMFEVALCYPNLKVFYNGERITTKSVDASLFPNSKPIYIDIDEPTIKSRFWLVPNFMEDKSEFTHGLVNAIPLFNGGNHIDAFKRSFFSGLIAALAKESKKRRLEPNRSDVADGIMLYNITQMTAPQFDSQSKTRLINESVAKVITKALNDPDFFKKVIRTNPEWIEDIYTRCAARTQKKDLADLAKMAKKVKKERVEDLDDACGGDRSKAILFLAEGKSAIAGIVAARNPEIHGALPLRGKVMNVREMSASDVANNEALGKVMKSIGLFPGQRVNRYSLRYNKVFITCDADEDGKNIIALLVNFFHRFWPELLDPHARTPFLYVFDTPLIVAVKGKERRFWYNDNYAEFKPEKYKGWDITRAKGLAALKDEDWPYLLADPKTIPIVDDGKLDDTLALLFDKGKADQRKEWIGI